jgi:hypothetical protein
MRERTTTVAVADAAGDGGGDAGCSPTEVSVVKVTTLRTLLEAGMGEGVGPAGLGQTQEMLRVDRGVAIRRTQEMPPTRGGTWG